MKKVANEDEQVVAVPAVGPDRQVGVPLALVDVDVRDVAVALEGFVRQAI